MHLVFFKANWVWGTTAHVNGCQQILYVSEQYHWYQPYENVPILALRLHDILGVFFSAQWIRSAHQHRANSFDYGPLCLVRLSLPPYADKHPIIYNMPCIHNMFGFHRIFESLKNPIPISSIQATMMFSAMWDVFQEVTQLMWMTYYILYNWKVFFLH